VTEVTVHRSPVLKTSCSLKESFTLLLVCFGKKHLILTGWDPVGTPEQAWCCSEMYKFLFLPVTELRFRVSFKQQLSDVNVMYVCPCIIYEIDKRYPLDTTIYLLL